MNPLTSGHPLPTTQTLPPELTTRRHWVVWRLEERDGKATKVPYSAKTGTRASSTDAATWTVFAEARRIAERQHQRFHGVGYVFAGEHVGVDLDHCRDPASGEIEPWALAIVRALDSYTENSPSGTGLHLIARGKLPPGARRRGRVEAYDNGRYFTVTGWHLDGTPRTIEDRQAALEGFHAEWLAEAIRPVEVRATPSATVTLDDAALIELAKGARNGSAFAALWHGDTSAHHGDDSAADLALCDHLAFWTGKDAARMDRLFRQSGLMRPKWDERRRDGTYGSGTIAKAIRGTHETYEGPALAVDTSGEPGDLNTFSSTSAAFAGEELAEAIGQVPDLPEHACLTPGMLEQAAAARAVWLESYIDAAGRLSPRTPRSLHEAFAIFALNTAIARRAHIRAGAKKLYAALLLMFVGRSTLYSKSGGLEVGRLLLREAGMLDLLLPSSFTPQALLSDLALHVPNAVRDGSAQEQNRWLDRHRHGAQRSIIRDELAGLLDDCNRDYNAGLLPLLLKLDGAPDEVDPDLTVSRGLVEVQNVCLSLIGATTPAAFRLHAAKTYHWANGLFGRFALIGPDNEPRYSFWSEDDTSLPVDVVQGLKNVYRAFSMPSVQFEMTEGGETEKDKPRIVGATQHGLGSMQFRVTKEAREAWRRYDSALFELAGRPEAPERLDATYGRLPSAAIRIALALAAAEWALVGKDQGAEPTLQLRHWAAAQDIAERWRHSAHSILAAALRDEASETKANAAARLMTFLRRHGPQKRGDVQRRLNCTADELTEAVQAARGRVREVEVKTGGRPAALLELAPTTNADATSKGTKAHTREDGDDFSSNGTTKGRSNPPESPFSAFSSSEPLSAGEWPQSVAVQQESAATGPLCTECGKPAARRWKGEPRCLSCHPLGSVAPLEVA